MKSSVFWDITSFRPLKVYGLFYPEDGGDMFLRNVGLISKDYTALYPGICNSSKY
jgi:hypothetical protein